MEVLIIFCIAALASGAVAYIILTKEEEKPTPPPTPEPAPETKKRARKSSVKK